MGSSVVRQLLSVVQGSWTILNVHPSCIFINQFQTIILMGVNRANGIIMVWNVTVRIYKFMQIYQVYWQPDASACSHWGFPIQFSHSYYALHMLQHYTWYRFARFSDGTPEVHSARSKLDGVLQTLVTRSDDRYVHTHITSTSRAMQEFPWNLFIKFWRFMIAKILSIMDISFGNLALQPLQNWAC